MSDNEITELKIAFARVEVHQQIHAAEIAEMASKMARMEARMIAMVAAVSALAAGGGAAAGSIISAVVGNGAVPTTIGSVIHSIF